MCKKKRKTRKLVFWGGKVNKFAHNGKLIAFVTVTENQNKYPKFDFHF